MAAGHQALFDQREFPERKDWPLPAEWILFIEDDPHGLEVGTFNLEKAGYKVEGATNGKEGLKLFDPNRHALVITDVKMPGLSGLEVLEQIHEAAPEVPVLVITAYGNVETAVQAMKLGAYDFIGKPFNRDHLLLTVAKALESRTLRHQVRTLKIQAKGVERPIVHRSDAMASVLEMADRVAPADATVLITGESGTGKELVARRIHVRSSRADGPFVAVNCAAVPSELLESELFGHEKGAFTGAVKARPGKFRQANGGTIFLDEVAELSAPLQAKLLRVLQERVVDVVGSDTPASVDVRIIAATNKDLQQRIRDSAFREDLYFRLNVVEIPIPPLRERPEDIEPLVRHFVDRSSSGRELTVPDALLEQMRSSNWPGNVRELENACERLTILCDSNELSADCLPPSLKDTPGKTQPGKDLPDLLEEWPPLPEDGLSLLDLEKKVIERVLRLKKGNVTQAAAYLGIPRHILAYRITKYGIDRND
jgi:two-component system NtrC family response regulator